MISAGRLRFLATAKRENSADNTGKKQTDFATTVGTFRCDLRDTGSTEIPYADGVALSKTFDCLARWDAINEIGLLASDRLLIRGRTFNIVGIRNEAERDRLATISVEEIL
jgi:hypothetical protein